MPLIRIGDEQIVTFPEDVAFPDEVREVTITRVGKSLLLEPVDESPSSAESDSE